MITKETAVKIFHAHQEVEKSKKLIADMAEIVAKDKEKKIPYLHNAFGERSGLQLGVPSGDNAHRLFNVNLELSLKIIEKHIEEQQTRLTELMAIAAIELKG